MSELEEYSKANKTNLKLAEDRLVEIQKQLKSLKTRKLKLQDEINLLEFELVATCRHPNIEKKTRYESGDYYNTAKTYEWEECTICGQKITKEKVIYVGGYG